MCNQNYTHSQSVGDNVSHAFCITYNSDGTDGSFASKNQTSRIIYDGTSGAYHSTMINQGRHYGQRKVGKSPVLRCTPQEVCDTCPSYDSDELEPMRKQAGMSREAFSSESGCRQCE